MTYQRILVAVYDSPAGLAAARMAVELARGWGAQLRAVAVATTKAQIELTGKIPDHIAERSALAADAMLHHVEDLAGQAGVHVEIVRRGGEPFREILAEADRFAADLVVMGRSDRKGPASPYVGSVTGHVLEFSTCPVLVVPSPGPAGPVGRV